MTNEKGMEMPITVMIVFFVSIAVALIVINFAGQLIGRGEREMRAYSLESDKADFFIETNNVGSTTLARLSDQCYKNNRGTYGGDTICYIVHAITEVSFSETEVVAGFLSMNPDYDKETMGEPINFEGWHQNPAGRTVYVKFDELGQFIAIES